MTVQRIEAQVLIPGRGDPVADGVVVMDGPRIVYAGRTRDAPPIDDAVVTEAHCVMPGMWDWPAPFTGAWARTPVCWAFDPRRGAGARPRAPGPAWPRRARGSPPGRDGAAR